MAKPPLQLIKITLHLEYMSTHRSIFNHLRIGRLVALNSSLLLEYFLESYDHIANSPIRTIDELTITETSTCFPSSIGSESLDLESSRRFSSPYESLNGLQFGRRVRHRCFVITARARSFLYHQVRLMVGVLKLVGTGELTVSNVEKILEVKTVTAASPMAPSCGLYLAYVKYDLP
ncbi:hypothetical protein LUZ60_006980 [Juncus effusus]|nr:hypothetical protein LUZ60_006980 [Juncus effusus]